MKRSFLAVVLLGCLCAFGYSQDGGRLVHTRQREFKIPFQVADGDSAAAIKEIQLYVARDRGPWELYTTVEPERQPNERFFVFRTDADGEYWFAVRTVDRNGQAVPAKVTDLKPELKVIIDATQPKINLKAVPAGDGRVGVEWQIEEPYVDFRSLQIEYRVGEEGQWKPVPGVSPRIAGRATWRVTEQGTVYVRAQVQDRAGNLGIAQLEIPVAGQNVGANDASPSGLAVSQRSESPRTTEETSSPPSPGIDMPARPEVPLSPSTPVADSTLRDDSFPSGPATQFPSQSSVPQVSNGTGMTGGAGSAMRAGDALPPATGGPGPDAGVSDRVPENRSIVRHTAIKIDYAVEDVGPSGVGTIQLWVTTDGGRTWSLYGEDPDRQPPFQVDLGRIFGSRDGLVGLKLVARSGVGLGEEPPTAGTEPDVWIELDRTPPLVQIKDVAPGQGPTAGTIVIQWVAEDKNLPARPVSLYYGSNGNWQPIATRIPNTGSFTWQLPLGNIPPQLRIGVDVVDAAGNRTFVQSDEVTIDLSRPKARVTGVMPLDAPSRR